MNGVTILEEHVYRDIPLWGFIVICVIFSFMAGLSIWAFCREYKLYRHKKKIRNYVTDHFQLLLVIFIVTLAIFLSYHNYKTVYTDYKVRVDDSVSLNEFINNYKIISYDGDIYTAREIEE